MNSKFPDKLKIDIAKQVFLFFKKLIFSNFEYMFGR